MRCFLTLLLLISTLCIAQETDVRWSVEEEYLKTSPSPVFLGDDDDKLYLLKASNYSPMSSYYIDVVNKKSLGTVQKIALDASLFPNSHGQDLIKLYFDGTRFFIFTNIVKQSVERIYGSIIEKNGKVLFEGKLLKEVDNTLKKYPGTVGIHSTEKNDGFLLFTDSPTDKSENETVEYTLLDEKLDLKVEKKITLPYSEAHFIIQYPFMDPRGNVYLLGTKRDASEPDKTTDVIFYYSPSSGQFNELKLPATSIYYSGVSISFDIQNNIEVTGLYGNKPTFKRYREGIYFTKMNVETGKVLESKNTPFDTASLQGLGKRWVREGNLLSKDFLINHLYKVENGNTVFILEMARDGVSAYSGDVGFNKGHMLMLKVSAEGKLLWGSTIPKSQFLHIAQHKINGLMAGPVNTAAKDFKYTSLLSYTPILKDNTFHLLYNDRIENLSISNPDELKKTNLMDAGDCVCFMATIEPNGKTTRKIFMRTRQSHFWIMPENSVQLDDDATLILSYDLHKRKFKIGILTVGN